MQPTRKRAVFLDRDGTLIEEKEYLSRPEGVVMVPGTGRALRRLMDAGYLLMVVTNQSGIGRGYYSVADMERVNGRVAQELARDGVRIDALYYAPEAPDQPSPGRKPSPQFLYDAREAFGLDLRGSFMVGDKLSDLECGWNAGVRASVLVRTGYGKELEQREGKALTRAWIVDDVAAAAELILATHARTEGGGP